MFRVREREHVLLLVSAPYCGRWLVEGPLVRDLGRAYAARCRGEAPGWAAVGGAICRLCAVAAGAAGRGRGGGKLIAGQLAYWQGALAGAAGEMELPADRQRPEVSSYRGGKVKFEMDVSFARETGEAGAQGAGRVCSWYCRRGWRCCCPGWERGRTSRWGAGGGADGRGAG